MSRRGMARRKKMKEHNDAPEAAPVPPVQESTDEATVADDSVAGQEAEAAEGQDSEAEETKEAEG